ncbi:MAG: PDZ domain-containing protein [Verrucomicrobiota bacterium]|nr:PDZ domain-containing protein [Verrucomicrobiota bacterium]
MNKSSPIITYLFIFIFILNFGWAKNTDSPNRVSFLGVHASSIPQSLSHQLDLPEGLYLSVSYLSPGSPAENAGIELHDLLLKFDDQILVNQEQLKALVRLHEPGDEISLILIRKGEEKTIKVNLGETEILERTHSKDKFNRFSPSPFSHDQRIKEIMDNLERDFQFDFRMDPFVMPEKNIFRKKKFNGTPNDDSFDPIHKPNTDINSFSFSSKQTHKVISDDDGTIVFTEKDGETFVRATDPNGKLIFEGPVNTKKERNSLPEGIREKLEKLNY